MKKIVKISLMVFMIIKGSVLFAQEVLIKEDRPVSSFSAIKASGIAHVYLSSGNAEKVSVEVNSKEVNDRLKIEVAEGVLHIRMEENKRWNNPMNDVKLKVFVTYKTLNSLQASGATHIYSESTVKSEKFDIKTSGANHTTLDIRTKELSIKTSGASNIKLTGSADRLNMSSGGASNIKAYELTAQDVKSETSGASNIFLTAQKTLDVKATGVSNINYKGEAELVSREVSKLANLRKR